MFYLGNIFQTSKTQADVDATTRSSLGLGAADCVSPGRRGAGALPAQLIAPGGAGEDEHLRLRALRMRVRCGLGAVVYHYLWPEEVGSDWQGLTDEMGT